MLKDNIDLNIWDRWSYETNGEQTGGWIINTYVIPHEGAHYGSGQQTEHTLHLRTKDIEKMQLDQEDEDFWVDYVTLMSRENTPRRVRVWLENVLEKLSESADN